MNTPTLSEIRDAFRMLRKAPGLSMLAIVALAFALGLTTAAFSVVRAVFWSTLPFPDADRIVMVTDYHRAGRYNVYISAEAFTRRAAQARSFESLAAFSTRNVLLGSETSGSVARAAFITPNAFDVIQARAAVGRGPQPQDGQPGAPPVVILSHHLWQARYGADPAIVGRDVHVGGERRTVVGIMPAGFRFPEKEELWIPISLAAQGATAEWLKVFGKLRAGVNIAQAEAELAVIAGQETSWRYKPGELVQIVRPYTRGFGGGDEQPVFYAVVAALVLLLLVAAANVANLLLARNAGRMKELALRAALGAGRARLATQLLLEAFVLCAVAAVLGYAGATAALGWFARMTDEFPFWVTFGLNSAVAAFVGVLVLLATAAAGIAPALKASRVSATEILKQSGGATPGLHFGRWSAALIVAEFAIAVALLGTASTLSRGLLGFSYEKYGLPASEVLISQVYFGQPPKLDAAGDAPARRAVWREFMRETTARTRRIEEQLRALPGVRAVTFAWYFPGNDMEMTRVRIAAESGSVDTTTCVMEASLNYFEVLGANLLAGRMFTADEYVEQPRVAIVNEPFAKRHFAGRNPLGTKIQIAPTGTEGGRWVEIIGVAPDLGLNPGDPSRSDGIYIPLTPTNVTRAAIRTSADPRALIPAVHQIVLREAPAAQVQWSMTLEENIAETVNVFRALGSALVALGGIALLLSTASLYAIVAFTVTQRTREIGIRMALGAQRHHVLRALLSKQALQLSCGGAMGAALNLALFQLVKLLPFPMESGGAASSASFAAVLLAAGLAACLIPARRALRIHPMDALRYE
jgi:predicted permease